MLDRFHVVGWFAQGLTLVRRDLQRRQPHGVKPAFDPDVFRARFALLRRADSLDDTDRARLDQLFATTRGSRPGGTHSKNCTVSTSPMTVTARSKLSIGSPTSTSPVSSRVPSRRRHHHCLGRRDLGLAQCGPALQRPNRRHQQPAPSPTPRRSRLHQPQQLRRPRTPRDMITPHRRQRTHTPPNRAGPNCGREASPSRSPPSTLRPRG